MGDQTTPGAHQDKSSEECKKPVVSTTESVLPPSSMQRVTIYQLPQSTIKVNRVSLKESSLMDPNEFIDKKVIG